MGQYNLSVNKLVLGLLLLFDATFTGSLVAQGPLV